MAPQWALLLVLETLLAALETEQHAPNNRGYSWYPEQCTKPQRDYRLQWDYRLQFTPDRDSYGVNEELQLSCPGHLKPSFSSVKCVKQVQESSPITQYVWMGRKVSGAWMLIDKNVSCKGKCQKPQWDSRIHFVPDQEFYNFNKAVTLTCPNGYWPSAMEITCVKPRPHQGLPAPQSIWFMKNSTGLWPLAVGYMRCVEVLEVVPATLEVSSTSIKLNWTCRFPDACQHVQATCRLAGPSSPPCMAEEVTGVELLHGQRGTFTCPPLQPFTDYTVTISVPPSTVLFSWMIRTKETVPQKPEQLQLDASTGTLRWKALPSCQGEIVGYQLNVTARALQDGGFLQIERLRLSSQSTEHPLPAYGPGTTYAVAVRGLTAVGPGAASQFHTSGSETPDGCSRLLLHTSPSQGTAVLPLHPISQRPEAASEHQLLVAVTHNSTVLEDACSGELQPSNHSHPADPYVAAVLNLSAPTDFVLGDGARGHGFHNAPLHPGWDYTALLRLARRSPQAETFTCVCYSFSMVSGQPPWPGIVIGVVVLLVLILLFAGIMWFVQSRRRKAVSIKAKESN